MTTSEAAPESNAAGIAPKDGLTARTAAFYRATIDTLNGAGVSYLIGGAYALAHYAGVERHTKDLDVFVRAGDVDRTLAALAAAGDETALTFPHWLAKARRGDDFIDVIFNSGNGLCPVDDNWFAHAVPADVLGRQVHLIPAEEMLWSKAFVMERERFDGADVAHVLRARAQRLDWARLLDRFGAHWPVLLSHLILFGYIYPEERAKIPASVMRGLLRRHERGPASVSGRDGPVCQGTMLSRTQYVVDVEQWGYQDGRVEPTGRLSTDDAAFWTAAGLAEASAEKAEAGPVGGWAGG
jgi:hypothetical protein